MPKPSFEKKLAELEAVVTRLESPDTGLEESVALFRKGRTLAAGCRALLDEAENEVSVLAGDGTLSPFKEESNA